MNCITQSHTLHFCISQLNFFLFGGYACFTLVTHLKWNHSLIKKCNWKLTKKKYLYSFQFKHSEFLLNTMTFDFVSYSQYLTDFRSKWKLFSKRKYMVKFGYMRMGSFMCSVSFKQIFIIVLFYIWQNFSSPEMFSSFYIFSYILHGIFSLTHIYFTA